MSWHKDQWRNDLVVICMKTCNLGIYLNFKNLSKTWHVNTQTNRYIMEFSYPTLPFTFKCYGFCIKCKEVRSGPCPEVLSTIFCENVLRPDNNWLSPWRSNLSRRFLYFNKEMRVNSPLNKGVQ